MIKNGQVNSYNELISKFNFHYSKFKEEKDEFSKIEMINLYPHLLKYELANKNLTKLARLIGSSASIGLGYPIIKIFTKILLQKVGEKIDVRQRITERRNINNFLHAANNADILFFFPFYHTGGAEQVHLDIVKSFSREKTVVVFTNISQNSHYLIEFQKNSCVFDFSTYHKNPRLKKLLVSAILKINNSKTVFGCNSSFFYEILPLLSSHIKKVDLLHAFTFPQKTGMEYLSLPVVPLIDTRVIINNKTKEDFKKLYGTAEISSTYLDRITIISNSVSVPVLKKTNLENAILKVIYCGRILAPEKRVNIIVEAGQLFPNNVNLSLYGPLEAILPHEYKKFYIKNLVSENEKEEVYQNSHILIIASYREGFPLVIMEAMAMGLVCISTDVGGISEHISHGENGFLIDNNLSENQIANKIKEFVNLLNSDRELLHKLSKNSYEYARKNFCVQKFQKEYRKVLLHK